MLSGVLLLHLYFRNDFLRLRSSPDLCQDPFACDYSSRPRYIESTGGIVAADHGSCSEIGANVLKARNNLP